MSELKEITFTDCEEVITFMHSNGLLDDDAFREISKELDARIRKEFNTNDQKIELVRIEEDTIRQIIADKYNTRRNNVCLYADYTHVMRNGNKVVRDFIYGIVQVEK